MRVINPDTRRRRARPQTAALFLLIFLFAVPSVSAAPEVTQDIQWFGTNSGYRPTVVYDGSETFACNGRNTGSWLASYVRSSDHGISGTTAGLSASSQNAVVNCALRADGGVVYSSWTGFNQIVVNTLKGSACSFTFTSVPSGSLAGQLSNAEPVCFSGSNVGIFYDQAYRYYNGTAQVNIAYPGGATKVHADSTIVGGEYKFLLSADNGRVYTAVFTTPGDASAVTFTEIASAGASGDFKPSLKYDGSKYRACWMETGGLYYAESTNFVSWTKTLVSTTPDTDITCVAFEGSTAVAHDGKLYTDSGSGYETTVYRDGNACEESRTEEDGYRTDDGIVHIWYMECVGTDKRLFYAQIGGAPIGGIPDGDNPIGEAKEFFDTSWGVDSTVSDWLFALAVVSIVTFAFVRATNGAIIPSALGGMLGVGLAFALGFLPIWFLLLLAFLIISIAATVLFGGRGAGAEE